MIVSDVGRITSGSSSFSPPPCVTTASSGENPATCDCSLLMKLCGISSGNAAFTCPVALNRRSSCAVMFSHSAQPYGPHDHAAAHRRVIRQLRPQHQLVVPFREIFRTSRKLQIRHARRSFVLLWYGVDENQEKEAYPRLPEVSTEGRRKTKVDQLMGRPSRRNSRRV